MRPHYYNPPIEYPHASSPCATCGKTFRHRNHQLSRTTQIHVNQLIIRQNKRTGQVAPPLSVRYGNGFVERGNSVKINGPSELVYRPNTPLSCGARVWLETHAEVEVST